MRLGERRVKRDRRACGVVEASGLGDPELVAARAVPVRSDAFEEPKHEHRA